MEILTSIFFYIIAGVLILSSLLVVFARRVMYSILFAVLAFLAVAGIYFMLNATFNAVAQIAIYVIAVSLLLIFSIMLTPSAQDNKIWLAIKPRFLFSMGALGLIFLVAGWFLTENYFEKILELIAGDMPMNRSLDTVYTIGEKLLTDYVLAFELVSVLLLVVIIGIGIVCVYYNDDSALRKPKLPEEDE